MLLWKAKSSNIYIENIVLLKLYNKLQNENVNITKMKLIHIFQYSEKWMIVKTNIQKWRKIDIYLILAKYLIVYGI